MSHKDVDLIRHTNVDSDTMTLLTLVKAGYGSIRELEQMDTPEFLDLVEFHQISTAIENHMISEANKNGSK